MRLFFVFPFTPWRRLASLFDALVHIQLFSYHLLVGSIRMFSLSRRFELWRHTNRVWGQLCTNDQGFNRGSCPLPVNRSNTANSVERMTR